MSNRFLIRRFNEGDEIPVSNVIRETLLFSNQGDYDSWI